MMDMTEVQAFADRHGLWIVEDAAHAFPAAYSPSPFGRGDRNPLPWQDVCGEEHRRRHLLLLLCQQDDHHRRRRHGRHRRPSPGRPHAADVASRTVARRLEALFGRQRLGLPHRRPGLQVQSHRHRRRAGNRTTQAGRGTAPRSARRSPAASVASSKTSNKSNCPPIRPIASIPGTCSPSACGWTGWPSTATPLSSPASRRRRLLGALAAAAPAPLLRRDFHWRPGTPAGGHGGVATVDQPPALPGHGRGGTNARHRRRARLV